MNLYRGEIRKEMRREVQLEFWKKSEVREPDIFIAIYFLLILIFI